LSSSVRKVRSYGWYTIQSKNIFDDASMRSAPMPQEKSITAAFVKYKSPDNLQHGWNGNSCWVKIRGGTLNSKRREI
jgi:hypothetical protein